MPKNKHAFQKRNLLSPTEFRRRAREARRRMFPLSNTVAYESPEKDLQIIQPDFPDLYAQDVERRRTKKHLDLPPPPRQPFSEAMTRAYNPNWGGINAKDARDFMIVLNNHRISDEDVFICFPYETLTAPMPTPDRDRLLAFVSINADYNHLHPAPTPLDLSVAGSFNHAIFMIFDYRLGMLITIDPSDYVRNVSDAVYHLSRFVEGTGDPDFMTKLGLFSRINTFKFVPYDINVPPTYGLHCGLICLWIALWYRHTRNSLTTPPFLPYHNSEDFRKYVAHSIDLGFLPASRVISEYMENTEKDNPVRDEPMD